MWLDLDVQVMKWLVANSSHSASPYVVKFTFQIIMLGICTLLRISSNHRSAVNYKYTLGGVFFVVFCCRNSCMLVWCVFQILFKKFAHKMAVFGFSMEIWPRRLVNQLVTSCNLFRNWKVESRLYMLVLIAFSPPGECYWVNYVHGNVNSAK